MTPPFVDLLMQLPSVQMFIRKIIDDIIDSRSVVVLLPLTVDRAWVWSVLAAELWHREFAVEMIELDHLTSSDGPAAALGEALHVAWISPSTTRNVASLLTSENLPDVTVLNGIELLNLDAQIAWMRFLDQWAKVGQSLRSQSSRKPVMCVILQPATLLSELVESNVRLALHWWWGFPSTLELRLLCRLAGADYLGQKSDIRWREHVLSELVGSDVALLERLWNDGASDADQLQSYVQTLAKEKGWTREKLRKWGATDVSRARVNRNSQASEAPPGTLRVLWAQGALHATQEHGIELHPATLPLLGRESELQHRLWRGQAELLLPTLDGIRLELCSYLTRLYGEDWPVKWSQPDHPDEQAAVRETPLACGWGYIEWLIRNCPALQRERRWLSLITPASQARNALAHYRIVSRSQYERVISQYIGFLEAAYR